MKPMRSSPRLTLSICLAAALAACGGDDNGSPAPTPSPSPTASPTASPTPSPTPTVSSCSLSARQDWAKALIDEWYLFPDLIASGVNKSAHSDLQSYIDALVAPARAQSRDRFFTYVTSASAEDALINSGRTAGFGFRLGYDTGADRVFIAESFESGPAYGNNILRGDEILRIDGTSVSSLMASGGPNAVIAALGPSEAGDTRTLQIRSLSGTTREVTLTKRTFTMEPLSPDYGSRVIDFGGRQVGYINLRTFIVNSAKNDLANAMAEFKDQGIDELVIDLRYNGGGLIDVAETFGDLLLAGNVGEVFSYTTLRSSKSGQNQTRNVAVNSSGIAAAKVAFIGTGSSASASELLMNALPPYLAGNVALIGTNTYGKPVGQFGFDDSNGCDDRLRVVTFKTENADREGEYYTGLAGTMPVTCRANDDIGHELGDPNEAMLSVALSWINGASCSAIGSARTAQDAGQQRILQPERPNAAQHRIPGLF